MAKLCILAVAVSSVSAGLQLASAVGTGMSLANATPIYKKGCEEDLGDYSLWKCRTGS